MLVEARNSIMTPAKPASDLTEDPQFFAARLTEVAQRIDIPLYPSRPHLVHGEVRREIGINDDTGQGIGAFDNNIRRMRLARVSPRVSTRRQYWGL